MKLMHIPIDQLNISPCNMRKGRRGANVTDILPSIKARGILQPLLVRPNGEGYEIVAGGRRYLAAKALEKERGEVEPLPCAVMEPGEDADAIEASLIENAARLDPDEMTQHETFARLVKEGRSVGEIAATFGATDLMVKRRLALGNLVPRLREAYRRDEIDADTVRHLTLASVAQQRAWLKLRDTGDAPTGYQLKPWLFGGESIPTPAALFPLDGYEGEIVSDLFGEDTYFADAASFWRKQNEAIAEKRDALLADGWPEVIVLEQGEHFPLWQFDKTPKTKGGKVYIAVSHRGDVEVHKGYLNRADARRAAHGAPDDRDDQLGSPASRPEMTQPMRNYVDLHRHAAVRAALLARPKAALRLLVAHAIAGSGLWQVKPDPQEARGEAIAQSLANSADHAAFEDERRAILALLGMDEEAGSVARPMYGIDIAAVFVRLAELPDKDVLRVAAYVMAETLEAGSTAVETAGTAFAVDMPARWEPDDAFFSLLREKAVINPMLAEVAGARVADGNVSGKARTQKQIIRDCLAGANGRKKAGPWAPRWMRFPASDYSGGAADAAKA